ncbi:SCO7613 C-terminal domain-containing membrane protein [Streptomyces sp. GC420]|uniref:SCO7613 C-terminal domain-containing membrane protein n=1 Tax=Streptomyces sp. GC420 TaxID=2697568 RepID=UPI0014151395|nr:hypothetical protein [Streptomyces sp. GC420]NBM16417.1 hypothetical protein [Streptomyces sp. GC420]
MKNVPPPPSPGPLHGPQAGLPPAEELRLLDLELARLDAVRARLLARRAWLFGVLSAPDRMPPPAAAVAPPARRRGGPDVQNLLLTLGGVLLAVAAIAFTVVSWGHLGIAGRAAVLGVLSLAALSVPALLLRRGLRSTAESVGALALVLTVLDAYALHRLALPDTDGTAYAGFACTALAGLWTAYGLVLGERLRTPHPAAVVAAQFPLPLFALSADASPFVLAAALLATGALDAAVALRTRAACRPVAYTAATGAWLVGGWGLLTAFRLSLGAQVVPEALRGGVLLVSAAAITLTAAWRLTRPVAATGAPAGAGVTPGTGAGARPDGSTAPGTGSGAPASADLAPGTDTAAPPHAGAGPGAEPGRNTADGGAGTGTPGGGPTAATRAGAVRAGSGRLATVLAAVGGTALIAAPGSVLRCLLPGEWTVVGYLLSAVALLAAVRAPLPRALRRGLLRSAAAVHALALLSVLPMLLFALTGPLRWVGAAWSGAPSDAWDALGAGGLLTAMGQAPVVLGVPAAVLAVAARNGPGVRTAAGTARWSAPAGAGALALLWAAVFMLPTALRLPYTAMLLLLVALTAAALAFAVLAGRQSGRGPRGVRPAVAVTAAACAVVTGVNVSFLALAERTATLVVLGTLLTLFAAAAVLLDGGGAARAARVAGVAAACAAVAHTTAFVAAVAAVFHLPTHQVGLTLLVVPAATALLAARITGRAAAVPVEVSGAAAGLVAAALAIGDLPTLALVLALEGVVASGVALRADRRRVAYAATGLFVLATWVRLAASGVEVPEAYTLPVTVPALVIGVLRGRRDPAASSWLLYGPGLAATLVPSLLALLGEGHWLRPLLLGTSGLALTLLGARLRLQAPLLLGGATLLLVGAHELAPYIVQLVGILPRWLPPALAGLLLLAVGATYERRLRDARRVRDALGRMR